MIVNFEDYTKELSEEELNSVSYIKGMITDYRFITNKELIVKLKTHGIKTSSPRIRKIINYIRVNDIIPCLIATNKGYKISKDKSELDLYIRSLRSRINSIEAVEKAIITQAQII